MIETEISILINRKSDIDLLEQAIIGEKFQFPVYILEYENSYRINFSSDYEQWELDTAILNSFPGYEFTTDLERGRKEIRLQILRYQSDLSTDGWGRQIENPLNETKYLVKISNGKSEKFNPSIKVLFEDKAQHYFINIVNGINKTTNEKGFLLLNDFKTDSPSEGTELLKDQLYKSPLDAFHHGCYKMTKVVNEDFNIHLEKKKKAIREIQKVPRKIIRDFVNACNASDKNSILKGLDESFTFEERKNWQTNIRTEGISAFKDYLNNTNQQLSGKNFKIRSSWSFHLSYITIGVKYYPATVEKDAPRYQKYEQMKFTINENKIVAIAYDM